LESSVDRRRPAGDRHFTADRSIVSAAYLVVGAAVVAFLSGCLFTVDPAFDETNSVGAEQSPELAAFLRRFADYGTHVNGQRLAIVPMSPSGQLRIISSAGELIVLQETVPNCGEPACVAYYAVRASEADRPQWCFVNTDEADLLQTAAAQYGVALDVLESDSKIDLPPDVIASSGNRDALRAFITSRFSDGPVFCQDIPHDIQR
jgi:hypothetical protein